MPDVLAGPERRPLPRPPAAAVVALTAAAVLAAGVGAAQRLGRVQVSVREGVGGAERSQERQVSGEVRLLVRDDGPLPVRVLRAQLDVAGVEATAEPGPATAARGREATVTVRFRIASCDAARTRGVLRLVVRPEHGRARDVVLPVSVDGRGGSARIATLLGFCAPPFSR